MLWIAIIHSFLFLGVFHGVNGPQFLSSFICWWTFGCFQSGSVMYKDNFLTTPWSVWELSSWTRDQAHTPALEAWSLTHWTTRESEKVKVKSFSHVQLFGTPWTITYQAPQSVGFSRPEYWSGMPFPSPGDLPDQGIEPGSPTLQADSLPSEPPNVCMSIS